MTNSTNTQDDFEQRASSQIAEHTALADVGGWKYERSRACAVESAAL